MQSSDQNLKDKVSKLVSKYADVPGGLLPLLRDVQDSCGCIPDEYVPMIATGMRLSRAEVHGMIGFYHDFRSQPHGKTVIQICRAEACQAMGSRALEAYARQRLGIDFGETSEDGRFSLEAVYCLGNCACSPSVRIGDEVIARVDSDRFDELLEGGD